MLDWKYYNSNLEFNERLSEQIYIDETGRQVRKKNPEWSTEKQKCVWEGGGVVQDESNRHTRYGKEV